MNPFDFLGALGADNHDKMHKDKVNFYTNQNVFPDNKF